MKKDVYVVNVKHKLIPERKDLVCVFDDKTFVDNVIRKIKKKSDKVYVDTVDGNKRYVHVFRNGFDLTYIIEKTTMIFGSEED